MRSLALFPYDPRVTPVVIGVASLLLRLYYAFAAPAGVAFENGLKGSDDEVAHLNYVRAIALEGRIPVQTESVKAAGAFERGAFEYYQPPLYYVLAAVPYRVAHHLRPGRELVSVRLLSVAFGVMQLWVTWLVLRRAIPERNHAVAAFLLAASLGSQIKATTFVSNDALAFLLASVVLLLVVELKERRTFTREGLLLTTLTLAWFTKSSAIVLAAFVAVESILESRRGGRAAPMVRRLAIVAISAVLAAPWYARNVRLYGEVFALTVGHGPRFDYPLTAAYLVPHLIHLPYEIFFAWYLDHSSRLFTVMTGLEYATFAAGIVLLVVTRDASDQMASQDPCAPARRSILLLLLLSVAAHAVYGATYGYFGPRQILGALAGLSYVMALPPITASRIAGGRVHPALFTALVVVPKHLYHLARWF